MNTNCRKPGLNYYQLVGKPSLYFLLITLFFVYPGITARAQFVGMTTKGGQYDRGVIFKTDATGGKMSVVHQMKGASWGGFTRDKNGMLYALAINGGDNNMGYFFKFDPQTNEVTTILDFDGAKTGSGPNNSPMLASNGKMYCMTIAGGLHESGVIFEYDTETGAIDKMVDFDYFGGPAGRLIEAKNGKLYGITVEGGDFESGTIFEYVPGERTITVKASINTEEVGRYMRNGLAVGKDGNLYGVTSDAGPYGGGALIAYTPGASEVVLKHAFGDGNDGYSPRAAVTVASNGMIYGTTTGGGEGYGTIFRYDPATGDYQRLYAFSGYDGASPYGATTLAGGKLYGMTYDGGDGGGGVIYQYDLATNEYSALTDLGNASESYYPMAELLNLGRQTQTIKFGTLSAKTFGDKPFNIEATASSGLEVTLTSSDPNLATVDGHTVTLVGSGKVTITASQEDNEDYFAAEPVSQSFCINPAAVITSDLDDQSAPVLTSNEAEGNQWFKDGKVIEGATAQKFNVLLPGIYTLQVSKGECVSTVSKPVTLIVTGTEQAAESRALRAYPNPAAEAVEIEFTETGSRQIEILTVEGRVMNQASVTGAKTAVDVRQYKPGIYLVKARSSQGVQYTRFAKQ